MPGIEKIVYLVWKMIQLSMIFHLLCLCGGIVFGIGPALQTIVTLQQETPQEDINYSLKKAFAIWKTNFKKSNVAFWMVTILAAFLTYNLYLSVQLQSIIWFAISFLLTFVLLMLVVLYTYFLFYEAAYEISIKENIKLSFASVFINFKSFVMTAVALIGICALTWQYKGLYLFLFYGLFVFVTGYLTKENRQFVDGKLGEDDNFSKTAEN